MSECPNPASSSSNLTTDLSEDKLYFMSGFSLEPSYSFSELLGSFCKTPVMILDLL